jgi:hypothetical protein
LKLVPDSEDYIYTAPGEGDDHFRVAVRRSRQPARRSSLWSVNRSNRWRTSWSCC